MKNTLSAAKEAVSLKKNNKRKLTRVAVLAVLMAVFLVIVVITELYIYPLGYLWSLFGKYGIPARGKGEFRVHFLDVGQGDCAILEFPDGTTMIIDGGDGSHECVKTILRYSHSLGIDKFDRMLLTHSDADHAGGLDDVLRVFGADTIYIPDAEKDEGSAYTEFISEAEDSGSEMLITRKYQYFLSKDRDFPFSGMFIWPLRLTEEGMDSNDRSAVLWLEYAGRSFLFTGDISETAENSLADAQEVLGDEAFSYGPVSTDWGEEIMLSPDLTKIDFLKVAHHGSASSSSLRFLEMISPETAFIGVGAGNAYLHPTKETIENLLSVGADVYRTDEYGCCMLTVSADGSFSVKSTG